MEEFRISRRQGLVALGATLGSALLGTSLANVANAATGTRQNMAAVQPNKVDYSVKIFNDSLLEGYQAIIFQEDPTLGDDAVTLAWMTKTCHAGTSVTFLWGLDYNFIWGQQGTLAPGTKFSAGQIIPADLTQNNGVTLSYVDDGYVFSKTTPYKGSSLHVFEDQTVPKAGTPNSGSVGVGMSGFGTFVVPTGSNMNVDFSPSPLYWIAFGKYTTSTVMNIAQLTVPVRIQFKDGETAALAIYDGRNWDITYS
ncbi:hypothetical protein [Kutzneria sp. CA-103260]|uniref:hypothetical protein n=1 Tax=Kutzneria sp. CA-103260 TaxID=2802641 RepID=UPI001BF17F11|nr:hypothetical protein [Kutzneria sp. CA-103260]QUQ64209.1 hypothetical protein JJ691_19290 [Kutzneria sp. CA-103260]